MRTNRRNARKAKPKPVPPDIFTSHEARKRKAELAESSGNYATRTIRKWIRGDPTTLETCLVLRHSRI